MNKYHYNLGLLFYQIANAHPENTALRYPDGKIFSYTELNQLSNRLARLLLESNINPGDVVAIFNQKSIYGYSLMLACIKTGIIYTNLDNTSPLARVERIIDTCKPIAIFFDEVTRDENIMNLEHKKIPITFLRSKKILQRVELLEIENLDQTTNVHGSQPCYIMFTSGSTGFPKGAVMSHNNVLNFIQWGQSTFSITHSDVFTNVNPIYFDNSVFDFYTSLFSGATLVPISHEIAKDAKQLVQAINQSGCTIWFSVPSLLVYLLTTRALSINDFTSIQRIAFGGEGFPKNKLNELFQLFGKRITMYNVYGPTECTCICSSYVISIKDFENMNELAPLGFISPNFGYEILPLDDANSEYGELALLGPCVGLGYYNDIERTAVSFVQNKKVKYHQLMYKTGDLVERTGNGHLYFKGRVDNQIKHMGYRIELEEIEAAFSSLSYINEVGVVYEKISAELGQIKAFVNLNNDTIDVKDITEDIKKILPPYMVPRKIVVMSLLPKNANGKIDRKQLLIAK
ncbi:MAG: AMP-binding protein [Sphingobacteriia bacterium]|jgi:D-alanine--poly(phosphoribitol) ligase subunit 1